VYQTIKSFVRRAGRISNRQRSALTHWLGAYQLTSDMPWDFKTIFGREAKTIIEIGFGMGDALISMAKAEPACNFIGIDIHQPGIGNVVASLYEEGITNVRVATYDAVEVVKNQLAEASVDGFLIFFPDPWHKKKHHKRRLIQTEFVHTLCTRLKPAGFIHCATDWEEYALQMHAVLSEEKLLINSQP